METARYRCTACGNLTRFDVTATRTTRSFHHYTVGGELQIDDVEVLSESISDIRCRWCGTAEFVVQLEAGSTETGSTEAGSTEAGSTEAGSTEAGSTEAGSTEAGSTEAGSTEALPLDAHAPAE